MIVSKNLEEKMKNLEGLQKLQSPIAIAALGTAIKLPQVKLNPLSRRDYVQKLFFSIDSKLLSKPLG